MNGATRKRLTLADTAWMSEGACVGKSDLFFPHPAQPADAAIRICQGCTVRQTCSDYARDTGQEFGIWGGLRIGGAGKVHDRRMDRAEHVLIVIGDQTLTTAEVCEQAQMTRDTALKALRLLRDLGAIERHDVWQQPTRWRKVA
jgi:hypothetical protein